MASTTRPPLVGADQKTGVRKFDLPLLISSLVLLGFGFTALYSVGLRPEAGGSYFKKQLAMALIGLGPFALFFFVNPAWWRRAAVVLYGLNLVLLTAVLFVGTSTNGAQRWIDLKFMQFQPSEMAKLLTVITLASFLASRQDKTKRISTFLLSFVHIAVPAFLIAKQPHYGGAIVLVVIWFCVCVAGNVPAKYLIAALVALAITAVAAIQVPGMLHGYHLKRIQALQEEDKQGASYQQDRAQVALGVGGLSGVGLMKGRQTLPEQENDFVFTVVGEELGLVGSTLLLAAFGVFFYRVWLVMLGAADPYLKMLSAGILGMLAFHTIVNLAMVMELLPVVGLWLPFISLGGTALWLCMSCVGLLLSIRNKERPILF